MLQLVVLWQLCWKAPELSNKDLLRTKEARQFQVQITVRHLNRLRQEWGLSRPKGRPSRASQLQTEERSGELVRMMPNLPNIGLQLFDHWMEQQALFPGVVSALQQAVEEYKELNPEESFPLLFHKAETLQMRFQALFYAPLLGIEKLTQYDVKEHSLSELLGRSYQSLTLNQFLGQLEKIDAAKHLMPLLIPEDTGMLAYIDGHMIAFWTSQKMHKGKITMLGGIIAGSQAVVTHNELGQALFVEYYSPDYRLSTVIIEYCQKIVESCSIRLFVIDREINSLQMAIEFETREWGLLSMLDKNEYDGLSSFDLQELETEEEQEERIYQAFWKEEEKREKDPRHFVLVEQEERVLAYWGTSHVVEVLDENQWPGVYRERTELQENAFKRMITHGALNTNYGTKKIWGPDRHHQRAKEALGQRLEKAETRQQKKASEVQQQEEKVMTFRTLLLENYLMAFMQALLTPLGCSISMEILLDLLLKLNER